MQELRRALPTSNERLKNFKSILTTPDQMEKIISNELQTGVGLLPGKGLYITTANPDVAYQVVKNSAWERASIQKAAKNFAGIALTQDDKRWQQMRQLINGPLSPKQIPNYLDDIFSITENKISQWPKENLGKFPLKKQMQNLVGEIATKTLIGGVKEVQELSQDIAWVIMNGLSIEGARMMLPRPIKALGQLVPGAKEYDKRLTKVHQRIGELLDDSGGKEDQGLLSTFARERKAGKITRDEAIREVVGVFAAAFETTATVDTWALAAIAQNPEVYAKLQEEAEIVLGNKDLTLSQKAKQLVYSRQCFDESARIWPPAWRQMRQANKDIELQVGENKINVPKDTVIVVLTYMLQCNPKIWGEDADKFDPEHSTAENIIKIETEHPGAHMPFNAGKHFCPGMPLASIEGPVILSEFARHNSYEELNAMIPVFPERVYGSVLSPNMK